VLDQQEEPQGLIEHCTPTLQITSQLIHLNSIYCYKCEEDVNLISARGLKFMQEFTEYEGRTW